jgi:predicted metal-dependent phosphoesterase TrpH
MLCSADLHLHSRYSDGTWLPAELVREAARVGCTAVAITDHDTLEGTPEAIVAGKDAGLTVLAGTEITCRAGAQEVHLLTYFTGDAWRNEPLGLVLDHCRQVRAERIGKIVARLNELGVELTVTEVHACSERGVLGRPHVAQALQKRGVVKTVEEAFERFLKQGRAAYVERYRMTTAEAIGHVRRAGGIAVLAHPGLTGVDKAIPQFVDQGLEGIEVWHPKHTAGDVARYDKIAESRGLLRTGGSDSHSTVPGNVQWPAEELQALQRRLSER